MAQNVEPMLFARRSKSEECCIAVKVFYDLISPITWKSQDFGVYNLIYVDQSGCHWMVAYEFRIDFL